VRASEVNFVSGIGLNVLSVIAALTVTGSVLVSVSSGDTQLHHLSESYTGTIFSLSIIVLVPTMLLFLATADWTRPGHVAERLTFPAVALSFSFLVLYSL
jgi:hypothetical protein